METIIKRLRKLKYTQHIEHVVQELYPYNEEGMGFESFVMKKYGKRVNIDPKGVVQEMEGLNPDDVLTHICKGLRKGDHVSFNAEFGKYENVLCVYIVAITNKFEINICIHTRDKGVGVMKWTIRDVNPGLLESKPPTNPDPKVNKVVQKKYDEDCRIPPKKRKFIVEAVSMTPGAGGDAVEEISINPGLVCNHVDFSQCGIVVPEMEDNRQEQVSISTAQMYSHSFGVYCCRSDCVRLCVPQTLCLTSS